MVEGFLNADRSFASFSRWRVTCCSSAGIHFFPGPSYAPPDCVGISAAVQETGQSPIGGPSSLSDSRRPNSLKDNAETLGQPCRSPRQSYRKIRLPTRNSKPPLSESAGSTDSGTS